MLPACGWRQRQGGGFVTSSKAFSCRGLRQRRALEEAGCSRCGVCFCRAAEQVPTTCLLAQSVCFCPEEPGNGARVSSCQLVFSSGFSSYGPVNNCT